MFKQTLSYKNLSSNFFLKRDFNSNTKHRHKLYIIHNLIIIENTKGATSSQ